MKAFRLIFIFLFFVVIFVGPWPVDDTPYQNTEYAKQTRQYIDQLVLEQNTSALNAGTAKVEIKPIANSPLAGYSARDPKTSTGVRDKLFSKAITLANDKKRITLLSAEILLPLPELVDAIVNKTGLQRSEIYFSATHTHSGPGGYAHGIVEKASMGEFSQQQFNMLVNSMSQAVLQSRDNLQPVTLKYSRIQLNPEFAHQFIYNQLFDGPGTHNSLHVLELKLRENNKPLATMLTFSAHPTFLGRSNQELSGDYPNLLMQQLEKKLGGNIMFSVGAVGSMLPVGNGRKPVKNLKNEIKQLNSMATNLADFIADTLHHPQKINPNKITHIAHWQTNTADIQSVIIPVKLPFPNYRLTDNLRLSPFLVNLIFHDNDTYIHALKIGKLFFLSYPADYSGELAASLEDWGDQYQIYPWATSFNGEYLGYLTPSQHYSINHYVTRDVNFYGQWTGDYFHDLSQALILRMR